MLNKNQSLYYNFLCNSSQNILDNNDNETMSQTIQTSDTPRNRDLNSIQFTEKPEKFDKFKLLNNQNLNNIFNSERDIENNSKRASDADKNKFDFSIKKNTINLNFKSPFCKNQISAKKETIFNLNN